MCGEAVTENNTYVDLCKIQLKSLWGEMINDVQVCSVRKLPSSSASGDVHVRLEQVWLQHLPVQVGLLCSHWWWWWRMRSTVYEQVTIVMVATYKVKYMHFCFVLRTEWKHINQAGVWRCRDGRTCYGRMPKRHNDGEKMINVKISIVTCIYDGLKI